jgi:peptide deformylase
MAQRKILTYGNPTLKRISARVAGVDEAVRSLVADLFDSMYAARGVGLAAPQIDELLQVIVVDPTPLSPEGTRALALINPEVLAYAGSSVFEEGCLSVPGTFADVRRPETVRVRYLGAEGDERIEDFAGMMARVVQHELDHLHGILFVDRLSRMRRSLLTKRLREIAADPQPGRPVL